jgi:hypothetical protein
MQLHLYYTQLINVSINTVVSAALQGTVETTTSAKYVFTWRFFIACQLITSCKTLHSYYTQCVNRLLKANNYTLNTLR